MTEKISRGVGGRGESDVGNASGGIWGWCAFGELSGTLDSSSLVEAPLVEAVATGALLSENLRVELSDVRDLIRCPRKLFLHERLQALQARKVRS